MMHCPNLTNDNRCQVASHLAECAVQASPSGCRACCGNTNPQAINVVTIGMAIVAKRRRNQDITKLKNLLTNYMPEREQPETYKIAAFRPGPGSELRRMLAWFARPSDSCKCETRAETMNEWGVNGCRSNLDTIVEWLLEEAELRGLPHGKFTRTVAKSLVLTAIRRFERKFPDGAPELDDTDPDHEEDR
jgi:hypothetical protein